MENDDAPGTPRALTRQGANEGLCLGSFPGTPLSGSPEVVDCSTKFISHLSAGN